MSSKPPSRAIAAARWVTRAAARFDSGLRELRGA
jgi:hypothetical protein